MLFQLLAGTPDDSDASRAKKWDDEEKEAVKFIYQTLVGVLGSNSSSVREIALKSGLLGRILDRVAMVAKENRRVWKVYQAEKQVDPKPDISPTKADDSNKKLRKKKGVGYASDNTGQNAKWDT